jgi:benzoyl-CoA reductase/2-hydroxyglutaryl-CoA dehydratase subunit BcrC/BadD/HgdB
MMKESKGANMITIEQVNKAISRMKKDSSKRYKLYELRNGALNQADYVGDIVMGDVIKHIDTLLNGLKRWN